MTRRAGGLLAALAAWMQPERDARTEAEIAVATAESLARCGLDPQTFDVHSIGAGPHAAPVLLVSLRMDVPVILHYEQHVEAYVVDRLHRKFGLLVGRIVFMHPLRDAMDLREARKGVRAVYAQLRGAPGAVSYSAIVGGAARNHHIDESALSSAHGPGESVVAGLDIVATPHVDPLIAKAQ